MRKAERWISEEAALLDDPVSMIAIPPWFESFVVLGEKLRILAESNAASDTRNTIVLSVPDSTSVSTAVAFGFVGAATNTSLTIYRDVHSADIDRLTIGTAMRIIEPFTTDRYREGTATSVRTGNFSGPGRPRAGEPTFTLTTPEGGARTFVPSHGRSRYQACVDSLEPGRLSLERLPGWVSTLAQGVSDEDYLLSASPDLRWVGVRTRIEASLERKLAVGDEGNAPSVFMRELIRPRGPASNRGRGWHTEVVSSAVVDLPQSDALATILDGNAAVARHLSLSSTPVVLSVVDSHDRTRQLEAVSAAQARVRWGDDVHLTGLVGWEALGGVQVLAVQESTLQ